MNVHVGAAEIGHDIVFLHEIQTGPASRSYGVQVAKLAGIPASVLNHARHALEALEARVRRRGIRWICLPPRPACGGPARPSAIEALLATSTPMP